MALVGSFILESNDNYETWLAAVGIPTEVAAKMCAAKPKLEVSKTADGITVRTIVGDKDFSNTVVFGKESTATVPGAKYTLVVKETATGYSGTVAMGGKNGTVEVVATATGFTQTVVVDGITANRIYKRL